jgi:uncharacterized membrane protein
VGKLLCVAEKYSHVLNTSDKTLNIKTRTRKILRLLYVYVLPLFKISLRVSIYGAPLGGGGGGRC